MALNREKYRQAILYFLHECNNDHLGRVKLMKLLYYLDFDHFERYRSSVTGDRYRHLEHGPVPAKARDVLNEMEADGLITQREAQRGPYSQHRFDPLAQYDPSAFSVRESAILEDIKRRWLDASMEEIVNATHEERPWLATPRYGEVSYIHAFNRKPNRAMTSEEREAIIQSTITSQAIEGIEIPREVAEAAFERVYGCSQAGQSC